MASGLAHAQPSPQASTSSAPSIESDTRPPPPPFIASPANQATTSPRPLFSGAAEPLSSLTLVLDGTALGSVPVALNGGWMYRVPTPLTGGLHSLRVTATDLAGNTGPPASCFFSVDALPPDTQLLSQPSAISGSASATFTFEASEAGASYFCSLDQAPFTSCSSPASYAQLTDMDHVFQVRALDAVGNAQPTPTAYTWVVDTVPPQAPALISPAPGDELEGEPLLLGISELRSTVTVFLDETPIATTQVNAAGFWSLSLSGEIPAGAHTVLATATDEAGNTSVASLPVAFSTSPLSYYSANCSAAAASPLTWLGALLLLIHQWRRRHSARTSRGGGLPPRG